jgi:YesN/AraC family two-component response regulator
MNGGTLSTSNVQKMIHYIDTRYMDPNLSVAQVSEWLHLSTIYTGALFKKCNGKSIVSYIHEVRIEQAKKLLLDTSINVKEVSTRVGYMTPDYFTRIFNLSVGVTPSKYRSIMLEKSREGTKVYPA